MRSLTEIDVILNIQGRPSPLCRITLSPEGGLAWRFTPEAVDKGLEVSPFNYPLTLDTHQGNTRTTSSLYGLPGFIADALPDRWGTKVMQSALANQGLVTPTVCDRLAWQSNRAIGALEFVPTFPQDPEPTAWSLRVLNATAQAIEEGSPSTLTKAFEQAAGTGGGAYPKFLVSMNDCAEVAKMDARAEGFRPVIVKAPLTDDAQNRVEYAYSRMASAAGITVPRTELIEDEGKAWYVIDRFDQDFTGKYHQCSLAGLLDRDIAHQDISAEHALDVTRTLTQQHRDVVEMFRRIVFNYIGHNCDDHGKNTAYLMDGTGEWRLSPWYDGAFCRIDGGHAMTVGGLPLPTRRANYVKLAKSAGIRQTDAEAIIDQAVDAISQWREFAAIARVSEARASEIATVIDSNLSGLSR